MIIKSQNTASPNDFYIQINPHRPKQDAAGFGRTQQLGFISSLF